ncbi:MAG TPA: PKD domain-containing protein [Vicinamibacteria bacterium]|nr:PKD domain-containing protein [Vicinamibacteria bacterium]
MIHKTAWTLGFFLMGAGKILASQPPAQIALDPAIECWSHSEFPMLGATVTPPEGIVRSRLYFRCSLYPDYYFVDLSDETGPYRGAAPQADESCPQVHYYVEALGSDFSSVRTEERVADVAGPEECRRRYPGAAWFPGENPNLFLGSLGAAGMAPGFKTLGIVGFISSTGSVAAASGGISSGAIAGIAAAGGAAAGVGVLATGGNSTTTTAPNVGPPPATTTIPATTTAQPAPTGITACFTFDPANGHIFVNDTMRIDGRCSQGDNLSYHYELGDGRSKDGQAFVTAVWPSPGTYTVTLTVSRPGLAARAGQPLAEDSVSRDVVVSERPEPPEPESVTADFTARQIFDSDSSCEGEFDGSPSDGDIVSYLWELDLDNHLGDGVVRTQGRVVTHNWGSNCFESEGDLRVRLTVVGREGGEDSITKTVDIFRQGDLRFRTSVVESSLSSEILDAEGVEGQILVGGRGFSVSANAPTRIQFGSRRGPGSLEAVATTATEPFLWRFDFSGAKGFVPGSLRTVSGQEVARDAYSVVLRFSGGALERARFEYRLEP